jgi:sulfur carrier protein ThiS adenylyltransferase
MKIGIAGAGGIGSNVAVYLVRTGVRRFKIVDFDQVEPSNLNRQFYFHDQVGSDKVEMLARNLARIAPEAIIEPVVLKLDAGNMAATFGDCDVVVEGFDGPREKKQLLEAMAAIGKPVVSACGVAGTRMDAIQVRRMGACTIVGDLETDVGHARCHAPKVGLVAAMMAHIVLEKGGYYD